jgi:hypothetical protein
LISTGTGFCSAGVSVIRVSVKKSPQKLMMILVVIQRLIGAPLARVGKSQESRLKTQDSRLKSQESRLKAQESRVKTH